MYVGGCSGGGVLSSWVIGHTDRFAASAATVARAETRIAIRNDMGLTTVRFDAIERKENQ